MVNVALPVDANSKPLSKEKNENLLVKIARQVFIYLYVRRAFSIGNSSSIFPYLCLFKIQM